MACGIKKIDVEIEKYIANADNRYALENDNQQSLELRNFCRQVIFNSNEDEITNFLKHDLSQIQIKACYVSALMNGFHHLKEEIESKFKRKMNEYEINSSMMESSYDILSEFCLHRNSYPSYLQNPSDLGSTERTQFIEKVLAFNNIPYVVDTFIPSRDLQDLQLFVEEDDDYYKDNFLSFFMKLPILKNIWINQQGNNTGWVFLAHHDVANINSDNANDNSASVSHMLKMASDDNLSSRKSTYLFTDIEEFGNIGARHAAKLLSSSEYKHIVNLELMGDGKNFHCETTQGSGNYPIIEALSKKLPNMERLPAPPNDAYALRRMRLNSICLSVLNDEDMRGAKKHGRIKAWERCHSPKDTIDTASKDDMTYIYEKLSSIAEIE